MNNAELQQKVELLENELIELRDLLGTTCDRILTGAELMGKLVDAKVSTDKKLLDNANRMIQILDVISKIQDKCNNNTHTNIV